MDHPVQTPTQTKMNYSRLSGTVLSQVLSISQDGYSTTSQGNYFSVQPCPQLTGGVVCLNRILSTPSCAYCPYLITRHHLEGSGSIFFTFFQRYLYRLINSLLGSLFSQLNSPSSLQVSYVTHALSL